MEYNNTNGATYYPGRDKGEIPLTDEDRCFRILARPPIREMIEIYLTWKRKITDDGRDFSRIWNIAFMKDHGDCQLTHI